jgi:hypothetical protein
LRLEQLLRHTLQPASHKFFDRINRLPGGMRFLVSLRVDLLVSKEIEFKKRRRINIYIGLY